MATIRYSRWDGTQQVFDLDEDDLLAALSDDVLADGDLARALSRLWYRGFEDKASDQRVEGLRDLIERLRTRRQQQLERHKLDSLMDEIGERLSEVVETERLGHRAAARGGPTRDGGVFRSAKRPGRSDAGPGGAGRARSGDARQPA